MGIDLTAEPVLYSPSLVASQEGAKSFFGNLREGGRNYRESECSKVAASGPVSLAAPASWPESKNIELLVFC